MNRRLLTALALALVLAGAAALVFAALQRDGGGPRVAADNPCEVFPQLDGALGEWMREQRKLEPALTCEHFEKASEWTPPVLAATAVGDEQARVGRSSERWRSPDGGKLVQPRADRILLYDFATSTERVLLSSGGGESWTDAGWMDPSSLVVGGRSSGRVPGTTAPTLTVLDLGRNLATLYRGPSTPAP